MSKGQKQGERFLKHIDKFSKQQLKDVLFELKRRKKISFVDVEDITEDEIRIPCCIFNDKLSTFESICKYLKENLKLTYHGIAELLKRDDRTIWTVYNHSIPKQKKKFDVRKKDITIPLKIFRDRKLSILEHITRYLKEDFGMTYHEIAELLKRDDRTIWTVYDRALKKMGRK